MVTEHASGRSRGSAIRWGILGAASIARGQFLPGLRETGDGRAVVVASRDARRGAEFAAREGVERSVDSYAAVLADDEIDAVYVALPNSLHGRWTQEALRSGKAVLCEKPLCARAEETEAVLAVAREHPESPLWEAFVFPFQAQHARITSLIADGAIGEPVEVDSAFHFRLGRGEDIRLSAELGGGALADVGCYPIRLAHELLGPADGPVSAVARHGAEVEVDAGAIVAHGTRRLTLTCGLERPFDTFSRILGDGGRLHVANPFHPSPADPLEIHAPGGEVVVEHPTSDERSFTAALRHIHAVVRGLEAPRGLALEASLPCARTLSALQRALVG